MQGKDGSKAVRMRKESQDRMSKEFKGVWDSKEFKGANSRVNEFDFEVVCFVSLSNVTQGPALRYVS